MLLAIDVGNTQTKLGLFDGEKLVVSWRISTEKHCGVDDLSIKVHELCELYSISRSSIGAVAIASVVPQLTDHWLALAQRCFQRKALLVDHRHCANLVIKYDHPAELGADRIADAVAAKALYGPPVVVVDFGTATNMEVVDAEGAFVGGIIMPGMVTSANALFSRASKLIAVEFHPPKAVIGTNTIDAIQSGLILGEIARIEGLIRKIWDKLGYETQVVATGGLASLLVPLSSLILVCDSDLTLHGIRIIEQAAR
ncbi:MAG: type III pantothenate kinase [Coriobacteriales bacterium]|nr:type III pantothenate kinase [Coriobacteriales bacterium]